MRAGRGREPRFPLAVTLAIVTGAVAGGCRVESVPPPGGTGSYLLEEIDGEPVPATLADGTVVESGTLGLDGAGTPVPGGAAHVCVSNTRFVPPGGAATTVTSLCKWTQNRQSISVEWSSAILNFGILAGDVFSLTMDAGASECPPVPAADCAAAEFVYRR